MLCIPVIDVFHFLVLANMSFYFTDNTAYYIHYFASKCFVLCVFLTGKNLISRCGSDSQLFIPILHSVKEMQGVIKTCS